MDASGYPTRAELQRLRRFEITERRAALDYLASIWHWPDFGVSRELRPAEAEIVHAKAGDEWLRLATGGWSGNEELLSAFQLNLVYSMTWRLSASGGLHIFQYPPR